MSALNFGAGDVGVPRPAGRHAALAPFGVGGVMWIYAGLYLVSAVLAWQLRLPKEVEAAAVADRATGTTRIGSLAGMAGNSLLGHPPALHVPREDDDVDLVLFDVGGTIYDDNAYAQALWQAVHEIDPAVPTNSTSGRRTTRNANAAPVHCARRWPTGSPAATGPGWPRRRTGTGNTRPPRCITTCDPH